MENNKIPTPQQILKSKTGKLSDYQQALVDSLVEILSARYNGHMITVTLEEIAAWVKNTLKGSENQDNENADRDALEVAMAKSGRKMSYDWPAYNESYASTYDISAKNKR